MVAQVLQLRFGVPLAALLTDVRTLTIKSLAH
jgi:hypothetical protein